MDVLKRVSFWFSTAPLLLVSIAAQAAPLNLDLQLPAINTSYMTTSYNADTDLFSMSYGFPTTITFDGSTENVVDGGGMSFSASISDGGIFNSGSFSITGTSGLYNSGTLLTGNLTELGYANNDSQVLEFLFDATGGDLLSFYDDSFGIGGIILSVSGYNDDNFNTSFSNTPYNGFATIAPVPVPAAVWLFGSGLLAMAGFARRKA